MFLACQVYYGETALHIVPILGRGGKRDERLAPDTLLTQRAVASDGHNILDL